MRETTVETYLRKRVEAVEGLCEKHVSPGRRAVPDRLITWPHGGVMDLVETKAPGGKPRKDQLRDHKKRADRGVTVWVLSSKLAVDEFMRIKKIMGCWR